MPDKFLQFLGIARRAGGVQSGSALAEKAVRQGAARLLILASDAAQSTSSLFTGLAGQADIPIVSKYSKSELGQAIGLSERAVIAITDHGLALRLEELAMNR